MAKKKKRRIQTPSLSAFDKGLYVLLEILCFSFAAFGFPIIIGAYRRAVFQDSRILAQENGSFALAFLGLILGAVLFSLFFTLRQKKQPLFGKSGIQYGPPQWKPVYPVFSRAFWKHHRRKVGLVLICVLAVVIAVCIITALVLPIRTCLYDDGRIVSYNWRNEEELRCEADDITEFRLYTDVIHRKGLDDYTFGIQLTTAQGQTFRFLYGQFNHVGRTGVEVMEDMLQLKALLSAAGFRTDDPSRLPDVVRDQNLTEEEERLLDQLFEYPEQ